MTKIKRLFCAWELGGEQGHLATMSTLGQALQQLGHQVVYTLKDLSQAHTFFIRAESLFQAPLWQVRYQQAYAVHSLPDALLLKGYHQSETLLTLVVAWRRLMELSGAETVFCNYAPTANIAAQTLGLPVIAVGSGFALEPPGQPSLHWQRQNTDADTALPEHATPAKNEQRCVTSINHVLQRFGQPAISYLSDINRTSGCLFTHQRELDVYAGYRRDEAVYLPFSIPVIQGAEQVETGAGGLEIFAYLKPHYPRLEELLNLLCGKSAVVCCPGLPQAKVNEWQAKGLMIYSHLLKLDEILPRCRLFVGHGGIGTVSDALSAGVPVLGIPLHMENLGTCMALKRSGFGDYLTPSQDQTAVSEVIEALLLDGPIRQRCLALRKQSQQQDNSLLEVLKQMISNVAG